MCTWHRFILFRIPEGYFQFEISFDFFFFFHYVSSFLVRKKTIAMQLSPDTDLFWCNLHWRQCQRGFQIWNDYISHLFIVKRTLCVELKAIIYSVVNDHWLLCAFEIIIHSECLNWKVFPAVSWRRTLKLRIETQNIIVVEWNLPQACPWLNTLESVRMTNRKVPWNLKTKNC